MLYVLYSSIFIKYYILPIFGIVPIEDMSKSCFTGLQFMYRVDLHWKASIVTVLVLRINVMIRHVLLKFWIFLLG